MADEVKYGAQAGEPGAGAQDETLRPEYEAGEAGAEAADAAREAGEACQAGEGTPGNGGSQPEGDAQSAPSDWKAALEAAEKQRDEYLKLAQRAQADFQNFKRRNASVRADAYEDGVRETLFAFLPTIDNLERALESAQKAAAKETEALTQGVQMTLRQMLEAAGRLGLSEVPALGEPFDPNVHEAVMRVSEGTPGTILEVFQKGYRVKDRVIRYAMVKVAVE